MADLTAQDIVVSIVNGDHDGEGLIEIAKAIRERIDSGKVRVRWWVHFDDRYISADSMNVVAARWFQTMSNVAWPDADPEDINQRVLLVVAQLIEGDRISYEDAWNRVRGMTESEITFGEYAQVNPPKDNSTSTS